ncbi:hypothetical protein ACFE04_017822 [Oxalis oulophora]
MKCTSSGSASSLGKLLPMEMKENGNFEVQTCLPAHSSENDIDLREVYFLILHFLSAGPCHRTFGQLWNELTDNRLLPRRYHAWFSRSGLHSGSDGDDGISLPLSFSNLVERFGHIENDHLVKLLKQLLLHIESPLHGRVEGNTPNAADVPTLLGSGSFSLLDYERSRENQPAKRVPAYLRWPHMHVDQVRGLSLREIGGGFAKHHRAPSVRSACYAIAKPSTMVQKMQNIKKIRGHRNAVYCAIFDRSGRYVITGSDDRLVKIWSMESAFCLASCRGHEGDITDLAVSSNNAMVASAANDFVIRVWRLPDGMPISVLRGHSGAVTAIAFTPRHGSVYQLLSSSDDGTCRIWDARSSSASPRVYVPKPPDIGNGRTNIPSNNGSSLINAPQSHQILCCAYNANGTVFVTGSSDTHARVWSACKFNTDEPDQPIHDCDLLIGHENDVNYVQFSGCAVASRYSTSDASKEDNIPRIKTSWSGHENIVTCSRDGSAIIWVQRSRRSHVKNGRWTRAYHLKVPPPPLPPQPARGGPRRRFLPTPRGVNMIIWSLDNRFVLAAIMDCRICVWNAVDGSLVHSLTGHTESVSFHVDTVAQMTSYVLDVHPFNPRIAMSAGYDGRTIIWDIWEGKPIRTYEIGRFKLVDGKFSPDGTSIVLSDDIGQTYFLNTGQGESSNDAKFDQFFLGDYRPLIRDSHGLVLDQETQLPPYRRNIQDLLCDSSMIPYPDPYQTMFQNRRLGALGFEWRPSSIRLAIGPDINLDHDYIMPSLEDLERMIEPLPEFIDAMYWEPENEVISNDTDSEYNATDESSSGAELGNCLSNSSSNTDCSDLDRDGLRRSRRGKHKNEVQFMTSTSGRRVKKRNLDGRDGSILACKNSKKAKSGRKASKKKSSKGKSSRPQRVAARNARNMLSKYSGTSTDEDGEDDLSNSQSELEDSDFESDKSSGNLNFLLGRCSEEAILVEPDFEADAYELPETQGVEKKKKLILKLSLPGKKKPVELEDCGQSSADQVSLLKLSSDDRESTEENKICTVNPGEEVNGNPTGNYKNKNVSVKSFEDHLAEPESRALQNKIKWGEVKARTPIIKFSVGCHATNRNEEQSGVGPSSLGNQDLKHNAFVASCDGNIKEEKDWSGPDHCENYILQNEATGTNCSDEPKEIPPPKPTKIIIKTNRGSNNPGSSSKLKIVMGYKTRNGVGDVKQEPYRDKTDFGDFGDVEHRDAEFNFPEATTVAVHRTRSSKLKASSPQPNARNGHETVDTSKKMEIMHSERGFLPGNWNSGSKQAMRPRSVRNRRACHNNDNHPSFSGGMEPDQNIGKSSWLMLSEQEEGYRYIPQLGDEVVFLRQGHEEYIEKAGLREGLSMSIKRHIKVAEICKVEKLEYRSCPGSGDSCCKLTLLFTDPSSSLYEKTFAMTLLELLSSPDFIIEKTWYDTSMSKNWSIRDKCLVWWRDEDGGNWWDGRVISMQAKSDDFPDSPWEKCHIRYKDNTVQQHCPWELHDPDNAWEPPHIEEKIRGYLLSIFTEMDVKDPGGFKRLNDRCKKKDFINRYQLPSPLLSFSSLMCMGGNPVVSANIDPFFIRPTCLSANFDQPVKHFTPNQPLKIEFGPVTKSPPMYPVPLSPKLIMSRLENNYYRNLEAVEHDISVLIENTQNCFGKNDKLLMTLRRLSERVARKISQS